MSRYAAIELAQQHAFFLSEEIQMGLKIHEMLRFVAREITQQNIFTLPEAIRL